MYDKQNMASNMATAWYLPFNNQEKDSPMVSRNEYKKTFRMVNPNLALVRRSSVASEVYTHLTRKGWPAYST